MAVFIVTPSVLILVLMEDALRVWPSWLTRRGTSCLNPCSNGRCSARLRRLAVRLHTGVLILVLMEDALRVLQVL